MLKHIYFVILMWILVISNAQAKTYVRDYTYKASDADSKITSRVNALDQVKLILLQEIGTHIRQEINITKDGSGNTYASEDVEAITAGLTKVEIIDEKWNGEIYYLKASIDADTERVLNALEEFKKEKLEKSQEQHEQLKANKRALKAARDEVAQLKIQLNHAKSNTEKEKIIVKYVEQVNQISLSDMVNRAYNYRQGGQLDDAFHWYRKAAEQGYAVAQSDIGVMYDRGYGVKQDHALAVDWYRKAAKQGHAVAQTNLGVMYNIGHSVKQDYAKAAHWFGKAAEQGYPNAQYGLGYLYAKGLGVAKNNNEALKWYRKAAVQGYARAQSELGVMYLYGRGVKKNDLQAVDWFRKAAEQGYEVAQYGLGSMYAKGKGVEKNKTEAVKWYRKAAAQGFEGAKKALLSIEVD